MEELAGPEKLEREIFDDAAKKAQGLIDNANAESAKMRKAVESDCETTIKAMEGANGKRIERYATEARERVPLEKTRLKTAFLDASLRREVKAYLESLSPDDMETLVEGSFAKSRVFFSGKAAKVLYSRMSEDGARKAAEALGAAPVTIEKDEEGGEEGATAYADGVVLRATIREFAEVLLFERRGELARALCPGVWKE